MAAVKMTKRLGGTIRGADYQQPRLRELDRKVANSDLSLESTHSSSGPGCTSGAMGGGSVGPLANSYETQAGMPLATPSGKQFPHTDMVSSVLSFFKFGVS